MIIGVVKEIKDSENRVGLIPSFVSQLVQSGHEVVVETLSGDKAGFSDEQYLAGGAKIVSNANEVYSYADIIVKIKEIQQSEYHLIHKDQIIFSYCHLATNKELTNALLESDVTYIAYETVQNERGELPLLEPTSTIAGRMSMIVASNLLMSNQGGSGTLISGVPGVLPANVMILGGGTVGSNAVAMACGMFANVTLIDNNIAVLKQIEHKYNGMINTLYSTRDTIMDVIKRSDIVIAGILKYAEETPKLISRDMIKAMKEGSVLVDVSIDQGGCAETSRPASLSEPAYEIDGIIHYCVSNMASAFAKTASVSLSNAVFPYLKKIADFGLKNASLSDNSLMNGINIMNGCVTQKCIAQTHALPYTNPCQLLN